MYVFEVLLVLVICRLGSSQDNVEFGRKAVRCRAGTQASGIFALAERFSMTAMPLFMRVAYPSLQNDGRTTMARKPATRAGFTLFDVVYEDGSQRSNRRVPSGVLGGLDGDAPARAVIEEQDRLIAEKAGTPALAVRSVHRSGRKKADEAMRSPRHASASNS
jgi:hypothetical protein